MPPKKPKGLFIPESALNLQCEWQECSEKFAKMETFINHIRAHINDYVTSAQTKNLACYECCWQGCGSQFDELVSDFNRHVYFHSFHSRIKCIGQVLIEKNRLRVCLLDTASRNLIPELPERLKCGWEVCEVIYDNAEYFYRHVDNHAENYKEGKQNLNGCRCHWEGCETVTKNKHKLKEHLRSHTQEKVAGCPTCGGIFSNRTKFFDHLKRQEESDVECYQCSHCNKKLATQRLLRDHMRHHVNHYKCPFCDMSCPSLSGLKSHVQYRHNTERPFKCTQCEYRCKSTADLKKHIDNHSDESPYHCHVPNCEYTARSYACFSNHFKKVHQEQDTARYACHVCKKVFTRGCRLSLHLKKSHKFNWPSGHSRFRYKLHEDGYWRLQTVRYESIDISQHHVDIAMETEETITAGSPRTSSPIPVDSKDDTFNLKMLGEVALHDPNKLVSPTKDASSQTALRPLQSMPLDLTSMPLDLASNNVQEGLTTGQEVASSPVYSSENVHVLSSTPLHALGPIRFANSSSPVKSDYIYFCSEVGDNKGGYITVVHSDPNSL